MPPLMHTGAGLRRLDGFISVPLPSHSRLKDTIKGLIHKAMPPLMHAEEGLGRLDGFTSVSLPSHSRLKDTVRGLIHKER